MEGVLLHLKWALQALAQESDIQYQLYSDFVCIPSELVSDYTQWSEYAIKDEELTESQKSSLEEIDKYIKEIKSKNFFTMKALERSRDWRNIRTLARKSLDEFGWSVQLPPENRPYYEKGERNRDKKAIRLVTRLMISLIFIVIIFGVIMDISNQETRSQEILTTWGEFKNSYLVKFPQRGYHNPSKDIDDSCVIRTVHTLYPKGYIPLLRFYSKLKIIRVYDANTNELLASYPSYPD